MASTNYRDDKIDQYLQQINDREKVNRRKRMVKIVAILAFLATGLVLFQLYVQPPQENNWRTFTHDELNKDLVNQMLQEEPSGIVIAHHLLGWDTIKTVEDYNHFTELVDLIEITEDEVSAPQTDTNTDFLLVDDNENTEKQDNGQLKTTENATLEPFRLNITGVKKVGENISFSIVNYDPTVKYRIDFGNGVIRPIQKSTSYKYPLRGTVMVRLIASSRTKGSSVYKTNLRILPPSTNPIASRQTGNEDREISTGNDALDINELNRVTAFTVPRSPSSENPNKKQVQAQEVDIVDLGPLENQEAELIRSKPEAKVDKPLVYAERMPSFPGGPKGLKSYLKKSLRYPNQARSTKVQGQVIVQFVIEPNGEITSPKILKGIGSGCDEEAIRVVRAMPNWVPGESNGLRVPVYQSIPINFKLYE
ncbi:MAG: energy transducer TonB [Bacteroidota bacterium]